MSNNTLPLISIVIPMYNAKHYIIQTLESVENQTYKNYEVLIVNDASTDDCSKIVADWISNKPQFQLIQLDRNMGVSEARNKGMSLSKGEYVAFLDSDDVWENTKLEKQIEFMLQNNYKFTCTGYTIFSENNENKMNMIYPSKIMNYNHLLKGNEIPCFTVMIKKELLFNRMFEKIHHEDYAFWLNILKECNVKCYTLQESLGKYRKSSNSLSGNKFEAAKWTWDVLRNQKINGLKLLYCYVCYIVKAVKKHL